MHLPYNPPIALLNISQRAMETYSHTKTLHTKVQLSSWQNWDIIFTSVYEFVNGFTKCGKIHTNAGPCEGASGIQGLRDSMLLSRALDTLELFCLIQRSFQILLTLPAKKNKTKTQDTRFLLYQSLGLVISPI